MRVVATRIDWDGTMQRRVVDAAHCSDGPRWEELARRAMAIPPPYRPVPGAVIYQVSLDGDQEVLVAEHDLDGPLLDLVTAVMAMGEEISSHPDGPRFRLSSRGTSRASGGGLFARATDSPVRL